MTATVGGFMKARRAEPKSPAPVTRWGTAWPLRHDDRGLDVIELRERLIQIAVALFGQTLLVGTSTIRCPLPIAVVNLIDDLHAGRHHTEGGKAHGVELG